MGETSKHGLWKKKKQKQTDEFDWVSLKRGSSFTKNFTGQILQLLMLLHLPITTSLMGV